MAGAQIQAAFESFPEGGTASLLLNLSDIVSASPPGPSSYTPYPLISNHPDHLMLLKIDTSPILGSPVLSSRKNKSVKRPASWPMPRAQFILDERRAPTSGGGAPISADSTMTVEQIFDLYGSEEGGKAWEGGKRAVREEEKSEVRK